MEIREITNKEIWENFFLPYQEKTFLQSWYWFDFQQKMGNKVWRWGVYDQNQLLLVLLVVKISARRGKFLLIQHLIEPLVSLEAKTKILKEILKRLKELGKEEKCDFIRIAPLWQKNEENQKIFQQLGFIKAPMHANAYPATWRLELSSSEEELLNKMRKTTRYLIRKISQNPLVSIEKSECLDDFKIFDKLTQATAKKQKFVPFSTEFIKNEFSVFASEKKALWFFGKYKNQVVAGLLVVFWSQIGFYHQAGSLAEYAKLSIPYLLQWEAIKEAKRRGCLFYDFWGFVDPQKYPHHPWAGPSLFKMGFGGQAYHYLETLDYPLSKRYYLIYLFERLRKLKRGL